MTSAPEFRVRIEPDAEEELSAAAEWYEAHRPGLGREFVNAVDEALERIAALPHSGAPVRDVDVPVRRTLTKRFPYAVVFMLVADEVVVIAVAHMKRRPDYWLGRLPT